jgi:hypothetical protein
MELSAVPIPADPGAQMRSAPPAEHRCVIVGAASRDLDALRTRMRLRQALTDTLFAS